MDKILVIEGGKVAESGTHEELVASGGLYSRLYALQEQGRNPIEGGVEL